MAATSYFWAILIACLVLCVVALTRPAPQRRVAFFAAALHAPAGALALFFDGYWMPETLWGLSPGIEDFMFNFAAGLNTWLFVSFTIAGRSVALVGGWHRAVLRVAVLYLGLTVAFLGLHRAGLGPLPSSLVVLAGATLLLLARDPARWRIALPAALGYPLMHGSALALAFRFWPDLAQHWPAAAFWSHPVWFGTPLGEIAWAALYGAGAPLMVAAVLWGPGARPTA